MDLQDKRILIIKPSSLGDIIHTLPLVHALKRCAPGCSIGWVVQDAFAAILKTTRRWTGCFRSPYLQPATPGRDVCVLAGRAGNRRHPEPFAKTFRRLPYDLVLDLHASFRSGLIGLANPGGMRIGFADARELNPMFQHHRLSCAADACPRPGQESAVLHPPGLSSGERGFFSQQRGTGRQKVDGFLASRGVHADDKIVYIQPAARWATKFWLKKDGPSLPTVCWGAGNPGGVRRRPGDRACIGSIVDSMAGKPVVAAGELNLAETASLLKRSAVYIGLDSGPMHMAAMAGVPVVALFGPTHPERVGPYGVERFIAQAPGLSCLGCRKRQCGHMACMKGISVDMVYEAALRLLPP
jgi:heptosyltransferase I